jgi:micrococcal nuclease
MRRALRATLFVAVFAAEAGIAQARPETRTFVAEVTWVTDGDTVWLREVGHRPFRLRLDGLDAPEACQTGGEAARAALAAQVLHRAVEATTRARDAHGRAIGRLQIDGQDVGAWLVAHGHAWNASYRGRTGLYADEERSARAAHRGVFAQVAPEMPREFRRRHGPCARP